MMKLSMKISIFLLLLPMSSLANSEKIERLSQQWQTIVYTQQPITNYSLGKFINNTNSTVFKVSGLAIKNEAWFDTTLRQELRGSGFFNPSKDQRLDLQYNIENVSEEYENDIVTIKLIVRYKLIDNKGNIVFNQSISSIGKSSGYSDIHIQGFKSNIQKFLTILRVRWQPEYQQTAEKIWKISDEEALKFNRSVGSYFDQALATILVTGVDIVVGTVTGVGEIVSDPAFASALQQIDSDLKKQQELDMDLHYRTVAIMNERATTQTSSSSISSNSLKEFHSENTERNSVQISQSTDYDDEEREINKKNLEEQRKKEDEQKQLVQQKKLDEEKRKKELEKRKQEELKKVQEAKKKQELIAYNKAIRSSTRVGAISCGGSQNKARIVGVLGSAQRPSHVYTKCNLQEVRYRCPSESNWRYRSQNLWVLNNACIGVGDDVTVTDINCSAEQLIVEPTRFSCDVN